MVDGAHSGIELPLAARVALCDDLQLVLVNLVDLALLGKQLQWVLSGRRADAVAASLDPLISSWRGAADDIAGQMRALGRVPNGQSRAVAIEGELDPLPSRWMPAGDGLLALAARTDRTARRVALAEAVAKTVDDRTAGLLEHIVRELRHCYRQMTDSARAQSAGDD